MNNYQKLSDLYAELDNLFVMRRDIQESKQNLQTKDHLFKLDVSPRMNSRSLMGDKTKYRKELLGILDNEIKERQQDIAQLTSEK